MINLRLLDAKRSKYVSSVWQRFIRSILQFYFCCCSMPIFTVGKVASGSMTPTLGTHDLTIMYTADIKLSTVFRIIIPFFSHIFSNGSYLCNRYPILNHCMIKLRDIEVGDIITFSARDSGNQYYLTKRIIAHGGDTVQMRNGVIFINDVPLQYRYKGKIQFVENHTTMQGDVYEEHNRNKKYDVMYINKLGRESNSGEKLYVPENCFVVFGDNRQGSDDVRATISFVQAADIVYTAKFNLHSNAQLTTLDPKSIISGIRKDANLKLL
jgi:signal peptidase I